MPTPTELILCIRFQNESFLAGIRTRGPVGVWRREPCIDEKAGSGLLPRLPRAPPPQSHPRTAQLSETESTAGAMVWTLDTDDFAGFFCNQSWYPLIKTLRLELSE